MKKILTIIGRVITITIIGLIIAIIGLIIVIPISNDLIAKETAKKLSDAPLPEQTEYVESAYLAGKLVGCGNGMQYFGAILVKSELSYHELKEYYKNYAKNEWEYIVANQTGKKISLIEHGSLSFKTDIESDKYFIIYSWGSSDNFFNELDLRGH